MKRKMTAVFAVCGLLITGLLSGCGRQEEAPAAPPREVIEGSADSDVSVGEGVQESTAETADSEAESGNSMPGMTMQFGYDGPIYDVVLEDNDTAATLADYAARR